MINEHHYEYAPDYSEKTQITINLSCTDANFPDYNISESHVINIFPKSGLQFLFNNSKQFKNK